MSGDSAYKVVQQRCPNCGAKLPLNAGNEFICDYCQTPLARVIPKEATAKSESKSPSPAGETQAPPPEVSRQKEVEFQRQTDPTEQAFSVLVPKNWQTTGGVGRPKAASWMELWSTKNPAKIDFTVMNNAQGTVAIRWLPDMVYIDMQVSSTGKIVGALFPPGTKYDGITVSPVLQATQFLTQILFPIAHSQAHQVCVIEERPLPMIAQDYQKRMTAMNPNGTATYDSGMAIMTYEENGVHFKETIFTVIENTGIGGDGKWGNKETLLMRAPANTYDEWLTTFSTIQQSVELSPQWLMGEVKPHVNIGFGMTSSAQVQMYVQSIIQNHRATKEAINAELFDNIA